MAQSVDLVGNTLVVTDIQLSATGAAGVGATGNSVSTFMAGATTFNSVTGTLNVLKGTTTATAASATAAIIIGSTSPLAIYAGTGTPSGQLSAVTSSLYLNYGGTTVSTRAYLNTGGTTWTAITTLA